MRPDAFAAVMATGIVSIAAADHGYHVISDVLAVFAVIALPVLMVTAAVRHRTINMRDPDVTVRLFTYVAACAVLTARTVRGSWPASPPRGWQSFSPSSVCCSGHWCAGRWRCASTV